MIVYLATRSHHYTMEIFLSSWGREVAPRIRTVAYEDLTEKTELTAGCYVFSDLERLEGRTLDLAFQLWDHLADVAPDARLLNDPHTTLRRYELLDVLYREGWNRFRAFRLSEISSIDRFPVFLRRADQHSGPIPPLLHDRRQLEEAVARALVRGHHPRHLLVVEYLDTSDPQGLFRKYAAFRVGDRIIPRHVIFSNDWILKVPGLLDDAKLAEEQRYLETNPHADQLRRVAELARVDYGRIDYAVVDGTIQVWEFNTNPMVTLRPESYRPQHIPHQEWFARRMVETLERLDEGQPGRSTVTVSLDAPAGPWSPSRLWLPIRRLRGALVKIPLARPLFRALQRAIVRWPGRPLVRLALGSRRSSMPRRPPGEEVSDGEVVEQGRPGGDEDHPPGG